MGALVELAGNQLADKHDGHELAWPLSRCVFTAHSLFMYGLSNLTSPAILNIDRNDRHSPFRGARNHSGGTLRVVAPSRFESTLAGVIQSLPSVVPGHRGKCLAGFL